jgi:hypothetical protein
MTHLFSLPILALAAAFLALLYIAFAGVRQGVLSSRSRILLLITAALVLVGTVPLAVRSILPQDGGKPTEKPKFDVLVEFSIHQPNAQVVEVPFSTGSGYVSIDCEQTRSVTVQYTLPSGAEQPTAMAQWVNTDNVEGQTSNVEMQPPDRPTVITAVGSIRGLHKTFLFNCPGGGHGELLLRGQYSIKHELPATPVVVKALHDKAEQGQVFTATLPQEANSQPVYFKATISAAASSSLDGTITPAEKGGYELTITARNGPLPHDIKIIGQSLVMNL